MLTSRRPQTQHSLTLLNGGVSSTSSCTLSLAISATDNVGVTGYHIIEGTNSLVINCMTDPSSDPIFCPSILASLDSYWTSITPTTAYSATVTAGTGLCELALLRGDPIPSYTTTFTVWFKDAAGNLSSAVSDSINIDGTPPQGSISINNNAAYTNSTSVTLTISASDPSGISEMCISNTTSCSTWEAYTTTKPWTLLSGDGTKTVYAWFKDNVGNANTTPYLDTIILDTTAPTDGATFSATTGDTQCNLNWSLATDTGSGPNTTDTYKLV